MCRLWNGLRSANGSGSGNIEVRSPPLLQGRLLAAEVLRRPNSSIHAVALLFFMVQRTLGKNCQSTLAFPTLSFFKVAITRVQVPSASALKPSYIGCSRLPKAAIVQLRPAFSQLTSNVSTKVATDIKPLSSLYFIFFSNARTSMSCQLETEPFLVHLA